MSGNVYGPNGLPTDEKYVYWHYLKLREGKTGYTQLIGDFKNYRLIETGDSGN